MPVAVSTILTQAGDILQDAGNVRWTSAELVRYLNAGRREMAQLRPDIYATHQHVTLAAGAKQTIPATGHKFIDAISNIDTATNTNKSAVRLIEREVLDAQAPGWHTETATSNIEHFMFDERYPKIYYVYPPAIAGSKLEIIYSQIPSDVAAGDNLTDEELYSSALVDYLCYRAFSKDAEVALNLQRAQAHYLAFANSLGVDVKNVMKFSPNLANQGGNVPRTAAV